MATINFRYDLEVSGTNFPIRVSSGQAGSVTSSVTQIHDQIFTLATATTKNILHLGSATTDDLADADFIFLISDQDMLVELVGTTTADNGVFKIKANHPLVITDDVLAYNGSGSFTGAAQSITIVRVRQTSGSTANCRIVAAT